MPLEMPDMEPSRGTSVGRLQQARFYLGSLPFNRFGPQSLVYPAVLLWLAYCCGLITPLIGDPNVTRYVAYPDDPASGPYRWLLLCRTMLGLFEAGHWPCALLTARQILTVKDRPLGNGILQSGASSVPSSFSLAKGW